MNYELGIMNYIYAAFGRCLKARPKAPLFQFIIHNSKFIIALCIAACLLPSKGHADTLTVSTAVELALANNYNILIARNDSAKAGNLRKQKYGSLLPNVNAVGGYSWSKSAPSSPTDGGVYSAGINMNWTLFDGFKMFYAFKQVEERSQLGKEAGRHQIESNVAGVITAYYNLAAASSILEASQVQLALSLQLLAKEELRHELGSTSKRALLRQRVLVNADSAAVSSRELDLVQAIHRLNLALGRSPATDVYARVDTVVTAPEGNAEYWYNEAGKHNAGLRIAQIQHNIAATERGIARAAFWPVLAASGSYAQTFGDMEQTRTSAGLNLTMPLFAGFRNLTNAQNFALDLKNSALSLEQEKKQLEALVYQQWERLVNAWRQTGFERQAVSLATQSLNISVEQYGLGAITDVQLREAQISLIQASIRFETAVFQYKVASVQLQQLTGHIHL